MASSIEARACSKLPFSYCDLASVAMTPARVAFHCFLACSFWATELSLLSHPAPVMAITAARVRALREWISGVERRMRGLLALRLVTRAALRAVDERFATLTDSRCVNDRGLGGG